MCFGSVCDCVYECACLHEWVYACMWKHIYFAVCIDFPWRVFGLYLALVPGSVLTLCTGYHTWCQDQKLFKASTLALLCIFSDLCAFIYKSLLTPDFNAGLLLLLNMNKTQILGFCSFAVSFILSTSENNQLILVLDEWLVNFSCLRQPQGPQDAPRGAQINIALHIPPFSGSTTPELAKRKTDMGKTYTRNTQSSTQLVPSTH